MAAGVGVVVGVGVIVVFRDRFACVEADVEAEPSFR